MFLLALEMIFVIGGYEFIFKLALTNFIVRLSLYSLYSSNYFWELAMEHPLVR
jgi:hypothetical protein